MRATSRAVIVALWAATAAAAFGIGRIASPPHEPPAPDELAASLRSALAEGDPVERQKRTASLLEHLDPDAVPAVAALYERMIPLIEDWELAAFFAAWSRFDPVGALDHANSWRLPEMWNHREIGVRAAIQVWAQHDPLAAQLATEEIDAETPTLRGTLRQALVTGWARRDGGPEGLASLMADLRPVQARRELIEAVARELVRGGGAEAALGWAEPVLRDEGGQPLFKRWVFEKVADSAAQWDPVRTAAWIAEHSGADYAENGVGIVAAHWGRQDGAAAMAWLGEQPDGELRDRAVGGAFGQWSRVDRQRAQAWLNAENPTPLHDPALESRAQWIVDYEPAIAVGMCERIRDSARQLGCLESTAKLWWAQDAVAAETWLQQSPLDEAARSEVRKAPKPQEQKPRSLGRPGGPGGPARPGGPRAPRGPS